MQLPRKNGFGSGEFDRRDFLKTAGATGLATLLANPTPSWAASEKPIKIGLVDPITSTFAALGGLWGRLQHLL